MFLHKWRLVFRCNHKKMCSSNLEALFINCKPFYSPREFFSFILMNVYMPPDVCVSAAMQQLAKQISEREQKYPDSLLIIIGDFNKANLSRELPKYRQHITCPTRHSIILNHCYTIIKDAYHSVPQAALRLSDHCLVHLIPTYRQKLKSAKPVIRTVKRWTNEARKKQTNISIDVRVCASPPGHLYHSIMINRGLLGNSNSFFTQKRRLTEVGIQSCKIRWGTD